MKIKCKQCGREFETDNCQARYCSEDCRKQANREKCRRWYERGKNRRQRPSKIKTCAFCGKEFDTLTRGHNGAKYCSALCCNRAYYARKLKAAEAGKGGNQRKTGAVYTKESLCWYCVNAVPSLRTGAGCSWSRDFVPVPGWEAEPVYLNRYSASTDLRRRYGNSGYLVKSCPEFKPE